jgi:flagellar hook assembly protein FlgD
LNYQLTQGGNVIINVFTLDGKIVKTLFRGPQDAGNYFAQWDGRNNAGKIIARGIYFIRIVAPDIDEIRKVMIVK